MTATAHGHIITGVLLYDVKPPRSGTSPATMTVAVYNGGVKEYCACVLYDDLIEQSVNLTKGTEVVVNVMWGVIDKYMNKPSVAYKVKSFRVIGEPVTPEPEIEDNSSGTSFL